MRAVMDGSDGDVAGASIDPTFGATADSVVVGAVGRF